MTFQPLALASVLRRPSSTGVSVVAAQDGAFSPLEVQSALSTWLPPKRSTPGPRVFRYCVRLPLVRPDCTRRLTSNDRPMKLSARLGPLPGRTVTVAAGVAARAALTPPKTTTRVLATAAAHSPRPLIGAASSTGPCTGPRGRRCPQGTPG